MSILKADEPIDSFIILGFDYLKRNDYEKALLILTECIEQKLKGLHWAYFYRGLLFKLINKIDKAISDFLSSTFTLPTFGLPYFELALIKLTDEKFDLNSVEFLLKKCIEYTPDFPFAYFELGKIYIEKRNFFSAIEFFNKFLFYSGNYSMDFYWHRGLAFYYAGKFYLAEKDLVDCLYLALNKNNFDLVTECLLLLGDIALKTRNLDKCINLLSLLIDNNPKEFRAYFIRGLAFYELGDTDLSKRDLAIACENGIDDAGVFLKKIMKN